MASPTIKTYTKVPDFAAVKQKLLRAFKDEMSRAHKKALDEGTLILKEAIVNSGASASGNLEESATSRVIGVSTSSNFEKFESEIFFKKPGSAYAYVADKGRRPGFISKEGVANIASWMDEKGIAPIFLYQIVSKIAHQGYEGHGFMRIATPEIRESNRRILSNALRNFKNRYK